MLQSLLTLMLFILPFLVSQGRASYPGLHTGLWISLFFWGRLHPFFSLLVFGCGLLYYILSISTEGESPSVLAVHRPGTFPFFCFFAALMVFCAFGNVCLDYGQLLHLDGLIRELALLLGFAGSLTGPILLGIFSDRTGPFTALMTLIFLGFTALALTTLSSVSPYCFPFASMLMQLVIGGVFTLIPIITSQFYGRIHLYCILPFLLLLLTGVWAGAQAFYINADVPPQEYILAMFFLLIMSLPLAGKAWRHRLAVL